MKALHMFLWFLSLSTINLFADVPEIKPGVHILDGGGHLEMDRHTTPTSVDWNNDGKKDLLVGQYVDGHIRLFINQGTDLNPVFNGGTLVEANGTPITTSFG